MDNGAIGVGLVGASVNRGWGWRSHVPALLGLPEFELRAICTAHQETAEAAAQATGARFAFSDYRRLVEHPEVDVVSVAVRVPWHREIALAAIAAGKHVYCEWPLGTNRAEVAEMAAAARTGGVRAMPGLQGRVAPWVLHLRELVEGGYIGRPLTVNARLFMGHPYRRAGVVWAAKRAAGNHILSIQTAHMLDIIGQVGGGFSTLAASIGTLAPVWTLANGETVDADAPDQVQVRGTLGCGASFTAHFAYVPAHASGWRLEVYGERGTLVATSPGPAMVMPNRVEGGTVDDRALQELPVPGRLISVPPEVPSDSSAFHVAHLYRRLAESIRTGAPLDPSFDTALQVYDLIGVLERSSEQGGALVAAPA